MQLIRSAAGLVGIISVVGIMLVEIVSNRPLLWVADETTGRVCPALYLARTSEHWLYYTTVANCTVSWAFAAVLGIACLILLGTVRR